MSSSIDNKDKKSSGPNYLSLINEAIAAKKSRTGVSRQAISKYIEEVHPTIFASPAFKRSFRSALKRGVDKDMITAITASSYKNTEKAKKELAAASKPKKAIVAKKVAPKRAAPKAAPKAKKPTAPAAPAPAAPKKAAAKPAAKKAAAKPVAKKVSKK